MKLPGAAILIAGSLSVGVPALPATAHPGGLNSEGEFAANDVQERRVGARLMYRRLVHVTSVR